MSTFKSFKQRNKLLKKGEEQEIYIYDNLPDNFRVQVTHILKNYIGDYKYPDFMNPEPQSSAIWERIYKKLLMEFGQIYLVSAQDNTELQILNYLLKCETAEVLYIIETSLDIAQPSNRVAHQSQYQPYVSIDTYEAFFESTIQELNLRFNENGIGYEYDEGTLIRKDSQLIHNEIVKPAIALLKDAGFTGPLDEFLGAYDLYREGNKKQAVAEASKSFESTMKAICDKKGWKYPMNATAIPLIGILMDKGLIPTEMLSHFTGLRSTLESGLPTISNKTSRHGQGIKENKIQDYIVDYALSLCAVNIVLLIKLYHAK